MLAYILALVVGLGSFALYMAAFFFPEVHRKGDFIWSGVGLFYALVLWVCAGRITGGVLLGQIAGVALLGWFGWQALTLRRTLTPIEQQTTIPDAAELQDRLKTFTRSEPLTTIVQQVNRQVTNVKDWAQAALSTASKPKPATPTARAKPAAGAQAATKLNDSPPAPPTTRKPYVPSPPTRFSPASEKASQPAEPLPGSKADATVSGATMSEATIESLEADPWIEDGSINAAPQTTPSEVPAKSTRGLADLIADKAEKNPAASASNALQQATSSLGAIADRLQSTLKSLTQRKSKPVYVRKAFRDDETEAKTSADALADDLQVADAVLVVEEEAAATEDSDMPSDAVLEEELVYEASQPPETEPVVATVSVSNIHNSPISDSDGSVQAEDVANLEAPAAIVSDSEASVTELNGTGSTTVDPVVADTDLDDLDAPAAIDASPEASSPPPEEGIATVPSQIVESASDIDSDIDPKVTIEGTATDTDATVDDSISKSDNSGQT